MTFIPQFKYTLDTIKDISTLQDFPFNTHRMNLLSAGSLASSGFMNPEGVMIYHSALNGYFKAPFDENHKG
jgi:hypothetical protein